MKLGVICDGISRDLSHALKVMDEFGLDYAELQFVWDKEVGDHDASEIAQIKELLDTHNKPVSCLSRHIFAGLTTASKAGDKDHTRHMDYLKRVIEMAHQLIALCAHYDFKKGTNLVGYKRSRTLERGKGGLGYLAAPDCSSCRSGPHRRGHAGG